MLELIKIQYLSTKRNLLFEENIISKILRFIGFFFLFLYLLVIGFFLDEIFVKIKPDSSPIDTFSHIFLFFFVIDIVFKFLLKPNKTSDIFSYLTLPIKRNKLFLFSFWKEMFSKWNFIWVILVTPFFLKTFYPDNGLLPTFLLISSFYTVSLTTSILIRHIKAAIRERIFFILLPVLLVMAFGYLAYFIAQADNLIVDLNTLFSTYVVLMLFFTIALFIGVILLYLSFSKKELYASFNNTEASNTTNLQLNLFNKIGIYGEFFKLFIRIIIRSKQFKLALFMMPMGLFGMLPMIKSSGGLNEMPLFFQLFIFIFIIGLFTALFCAPMLSLISTCFDGLISNKAEIPFLFLKSLYAFIFPISSFLSIFMMFITRNYLLSISAFFFVVGPMSFLLYQNAIYNKKPFSVLENPFNTKNNGVSLSNLVFGSLIFVSIGFVSLIGIFTNNIVASYFLLFVGIAFTITVPFWLRNIYKRFLQRKYENMEGFREN